MTEEQCRLAFEAYIVKINEDFFKARGSYLSLSEIQGYYDLFLNKINGAGALYNKYFEYQVGDIAVSKNNDIYQCLIAGSGNDIEDPVYFKNISTTGASGAVSDIVAAVRTGPNLSTLSSINFIEVIKDTVNLNIARFYFDLPFGTTLRDYQHIVSINRYGPLSSYSRQMFNYVKVIDDDGTGKECLELEAIYSNVADTPDFKDTYLSLMIVK